jgi:hypothetical protein
LEDDSLAGREVSARDPDRSLDHAATEVQVLDEFNYWQLSRQGRLWAAPRIFLAVISSMPRRTVEQ